MYERQTNPLSYIDIIYQKIRVDFRSSSGYLQGQNNMVTTNI